jgi:predicted nucleic acid-binding protein
MMDALIAAVAAEVGASIVTSNGRHFPMGLPLLNPRTWTP